MSIEDAIAGKFPEFAITAGKSCAKKVFLTAGEPETVEFNQETLALICGIAISATLHTVEEHLSKLMGDEVAKRLIFPLNKT